MKRDKNNTRFPWFFTLFFLNIGARKNSYPLALCSIKNWGIICLLSSAYWSLATSWHPILSAVRQGPSLPFVSDADKPAAIQGRKCRNTYPLWPLLQSVNYKISSRKTFTCQFEFLSENSMGENNNSKANVDELTSFLQTFYKSVHLLSLRALPSIYTALFQWKLSICDSILWLF